MFKKIEEELSQNRKDFNEIKTYVSKKDAKLKSLNVELKKAKKNFVFLKDKKDQEIDDIADMFDKIDNLDYNIGQEARKRKIKAKELKGLKKVLARKTKFRDNMSELRRK